MKIHHKNGTYDTLFERDDCGFIFIISKHLSIFTECGNWFIYLIGKKRTIRLSSAGNRAHKKQVIDYMEGEKNDKEVSL